MKKFYLVCILAVTVLTGCMTTPTAHPTSIVHYRIPALQNPPQVEWFYNSQISAAQAIKEYDQAISNYVKYLTGRQRYIRSVYKLTDSEEQLDCMIDPMTKAFIPPVPNLVGKGPAQINDALITHIEILRKALKVQNERASLHNVKMKEELKKCTIINY